MYITCIILEKHFRISIAPVRSRGGSLVIYKSLISSERNVLIVASVG
jgi:hypothetical protein